MAAGILSCAPGLAAGTPAVPEDPEGWGRQALWGIGPDTYWVTSPADSGLGTLREALEDERPLRVVFDASMTIKLRKPIRVRSYKYVDGGGRQITIDTNTRITTCPKPADDDVTTDGLILADVTHVAVRNLTFDDGWSRWTEDCEGSDAIYLVGSTRHVWIDHNFFTHWADGAVDMDPADPDDPNSPYPSDITVSWNWYQEIYQANLWNKVDYVSFHHNYCIDVAKRCPEAGDGRVHAYNNLIESWQNEKIIRVKGGGHLWSDHNMFQREPGEWDGQDVYNTDGEASSIHHDGYKAWGGVNFIRVSNRTPDEAFEDASDGISTVTRCPSTEDPCWEALRARIRDEAGPGR